VLGRLIARLRERGTWRDTVLIVTADHGFTSLVPTAERPDPVIVFGRTLAREGVEGVVAVAEGGVEHIYAEGLDPQAASVGEAAATLARVAELARRTPGVAEVLARLPVDGVDALAEKHPDWHLAHPRMGELVLVAAPGYQFVDPYDKVDAGLLGNHGGPQDLAVPLIVTGGSAAIIAAPAGSGTPGSVDVAPTVAVLLGLPTPRRLDGGAPSAAGRPIAAVLAPAPKR
jgi:arylsulfatase A-like enzyme